MRHLLLALLLMTVTGPVNADPALARLLAGTEVTPPLSGLQLSLLDGGKPAESLSYGFAQLTTEGPMPLLPEHKIRVASISKLAVAVGVMQLVERGQLDLDADLSTVLGWPLRNPAFPDTPITARHLLAHTSSIRDGEAYFIAAGAGTLQDFFTPGTAHWEDGVHFTQAAAEAPGQYFLYSNLNFGVLATLIELQSGQRFDRYMAQQVLEPLGLGASFDPCAIPEHLRAAAFRKRPVDSDSWEPKGPWVAQVDGAHIPPRCIYGRSGPAEAAAFLEGYVAGSNATLFSPQGGLRASADDLRVILQLLVGGGEVAGQRVLSADSVAEMIAPVWTLNAAGSNGLSAGEAEPGGPTDGLMTRYGLSVHHIDLQAWGLSEVPATLIGHLGEAYGVLSMALLNPATGDGIAAIITGTADDPARSPAGSSPLYRVEEELLRWWLSRDSLLLRTTQQ